MQICYNGIDALILLKNISSGGDIMFDVNECTQIVERMNKEDFHQQIVRGVLASNEFSRLMSIGLSAIDEDDKRRICSQLTAAKVPVEYSLEEGFDENLVRLANCITARAVSVR